jgi:Rieske Fe-S protein
MQMDTRRDFMKKMVGLCAAASMGALIEQDAEAMWPFGSKERWLSIGKLGDLPDGKSLPIETAVGVESGKTIKRPKLIAERRGDKVYVMSTKCTHFGCEVKPEADGSYHCPCHDSLFDKSGTVTKGPAKKPLPWYEVKITESGDVQVDTETVIAAPAI